MNPPKRASVPTAYKLMYLSTPENEPEDKLVDASLALDTEPLNDNESVDAARGETVPKFVTVIIDKHAAYESIGVSAKLDIESPRRERVCRQRTS
jgi:hypothetical protein